MLALKLARYRTEGLRLLPVPRGCTGARPGCGTRKKSRSELMLSAADSKGGPSRFRVTGGVRSSAGFMTTTVPVPPGAASCHRQSTSTLVREFRGLNSAAAGAGFPSLSPLRSAILSYCGGSDQVASTLR